MKCSKTQQAVEAREMLKQAKEANIIRVFRKSIGKTQREIDEALGLRIGACLTWERPGKSDEWYEKRLERIKAALRWRE